MSTYFSIENQSEGYYESKGSKFISFAYPVHNEADIKMHLEKLKELHPKATHHCYAYRLGVDKNNYRANDDGEPSGSAGRPILGQIDSHGLSFVLVIVVRYYGGTKLGVSGLISAYKKAANEALEKALKIEQELEAQMAIECSYLEVNDLLNFLKKSKIENIQQDYTDLCKISFKFPLSMQESLSLWLQENSFNFSISNN
ncbi:MAG: YigZ family protein [Chitinophagales bacterium]|nr:YigZ family protein [Chitinophagales bacterium]